MMYSANIENSNGISEFFKKSNYYDLMKDVLDKITENSTINIYDDNRYIAEIHVKNISELGQSNKYVDFLRQLEDVINLYKNIEFECTLKLKV